MKTKLTIALLGGLLFTLTALLVAQNTSSKSDKESGSTQSATSTVSTEKTWKLPKGWTADKAYKSNCTRCHSEVPKLGTGRTTTIVRHMRVRANLTSDEAEAILEYMNK